MRRENLLENLAMLEKQLFWLRHSFEQCRRIGLKTTYRTEEFDAYENLCSRFGRTIDFLVRKMFRSIDDVEFEAQGTLIDTVNRAHKRGLFDEIDVLREIKDVRNMIAHEYVDDALAELFADVVRLTPWLTETAERTLAYCKRYGDAS